MTLSNISLQFTPSPVIDPGLSSACQLTPVQCIPVIPITWLVMLLLNIGWAFYSTHLEFQLLHRKIGFDGHWFQWQLYYFANLGLILIMAAELFFFSGA